MAHRRYVFYVVAILHPPPSRPLTSSPSRPVFYTQVALVRMGADAKSPPELRRNYKNVIDCLVRIFKEEGPSKLFAGGTPTIIRATLLSSAVLGCYSEAKERVCSREEREREELDRTGRGAVCV